MRTGRETHIVFHDGSGHSAGIAYPSGVATPDHTGHGRYFVEFDRDDPAEVAAAERIIGRKIEFWEDLENQK